jgi:SNF2 family DNA or RNA helicase
MMLEVGPHTPHTPAQAEAVEWLRDKPRAILGIGCGIGKSRIAIDTLHFQMLVGDCQSVLVLAPKNASLITWPAEIEKWAPGLKVNVLNQTWEWDDSDVYVLHYDIVKKLVAFIKKTKFWPCDAVIIDECTVARNPEAVRMVQLAPVLQRAKFVYGLTGTPGPNTEADVYGQCQAVFQSDNPFGDSKHRFERAYFEQGYMRWDKTLKDGAKEEIREKLEGRMLCMKSSDYLDLPDIAYVDVPIKFPRALRTQYDELKEKLFLELEDGEITAVSAGVLVNKLLQFTSGNIYEQVPHPTIEGKMLKKVHHLHDLKTKALLKIKERPLLVMRNFQSTDVPGAVHLTPDNVPDWNAKKIPLAIGHPGGIGISVNLQAGGSTLCWHTPTYSLLDRIQAEARLWRMGQKDPVVVYRLLVENTVDIAVEAAVAMKDTEQDALMNALSITRKL